MKKEQLIGAVIGVVLSVVGGLLSLNVQQIKDGVCGVSAPVATIK